MQFLIPDSSNSGTDKLEEDRKRQRGFKDKTLEKVWKESISFKTLCDIIVNFEAFSIRLFWIFINFQSKEGFDQFLMNMGSNILEKCKQLVVFV